MFNDAFLFISTQFLFDFLMDMERNPSGLLCNRRNCWVNMQFHFRVFEFANTLEQRRVLCVQFVLGRGVLLNSSDVYIKDTESCGCLAAKKRAMIPLEDMNGRDTLVVLVSDEASELSYGSVCQSTNTQANVWTMVGE